MEEAQTAAGASLMFNRQRYYRSPYEQDWPWCGYGSSGIARRYAEDILRRELQKLDERLHYQLKGLGAELSYGGYSYDCYYYKEMYLEQYRRDKEHLYRQFDTYNNERYYPMDPYYKYYFANPYNMFKENPNMSAKRFIIIGTSGAAAHPTEHTSLSSAEAEATRLSKKTPGEEFVVYQTVESFKVAAPEPVKKTYY